MKTVRFFAFINGAVKLTLREGQSLSHVTGGPTDEGYCYSHLTWEFDGEFVTMEADCRAQDCDGRLDTHSTARCPVGKLKAGYVEDDDATVAYPAWEDHRTSQRDYSAEAMGY